MGSQGGVGGERGVGRGRGEGVGKLRNSKVKLMWWWFERIAVTVRLRLRCFLLSLNHFRRRLSRPCQLTEVASPLSLTPQYCCSLSCHLLLHWAPLTLIFSLYISTSSLKLYFCVCQYNIDTSNLFKSLV